MKEALLELVGLLIIVISIAGIVAWIYLAHEITIGKFTTYERIHNEELYKDAVTMFAVYVGWGIGTCLSTIGFGLLLLALADISDKVKEIADQITKQGTTAIKEGSGEGESG